MKRKISFSPLILIFGLIGLLSMFTNRAVAEPARLKVGVILPLTGPLSEYGVAAQNGIALAVQEHPELFKQIDFITEDSQYDSPKTLASFGKLRVADNISLAYIWGYGPVQAVAPIAEREHFPVLAVSAERSAFKGKHYTLRFGYHIDMAAERLLEQLRARKLRRLGIVKVELAYLNGLIESLEKRLNPGETLEILDTYQFSDSDFKSSITKLRSKVVDAIGVFLLDGQISQFYKQLRQFGVTQPTFGTDLFDSMREVRAAQGSMTGAFFAAPYTEPEFHSRYLKQFQNDYQVAWAANAYEFALLTGRLFGGGGAPPSSEAIVSRYVAETLIQGSAAKYNFTRAPEGDGFNFEVVAREIKESSIVDLPKVQLQ